jgi:hypothetical protein
MFCAFVFAFDIVKTCRATRWHIDCEMPCQKAGREALSFEFWVLS